MLDPIEQIRREIIGHADNAAYGELGYEPLFSAVPTARIVIIGQAPGIRAQTSGKVWDDASGKKLMQWLGVDDAMFRSSGLIAHLPMDFYYPGKGSSGDLPPRKGFAELWHERLLAHMPAIELSVLIGAYAHAYYLGKSREGSLTETVRNYRRYLPEFFPLVHPSPLNFRWFAKHPWFEQEVVPALRARVAEVIGAGKRA